MATAIHIPAVRQRFQPPVEKQYIPERVETIDDILSQFVIQYPAKYSGRVNERTMKACSTVARVLGDVFDPTTLSMSLATHLKNDYFRIIAEQDRLGRSLIAFDGDWVIYGIERYTKEHATYSLQNSGLARIINYNVATGSDLKERYTNTGGLSLSTVNIFSFPFNDRVNIVGESRLAEINMIFAEVTEAEVDKISLFLYRDMKLYDRENFMVIKTFDESELKAFSHVYPVEVEMVSTNAVLTSRVMTREGMLDAWYRKRVNFSFNQCDDLDGLYAATLLEEATGGRFEIEWVDRTLIVNNCGYLQAGGLIDYFVKYVREIHRLGIEYEEGEGEGREIVDISTGVKYHCIGSMKEEFVPFEYSIEEPLHWRDGVWFYINSYDVEREVGRGEYDPSVEEMFVRGELTSNYTNNVYTNYGILI